MRRFHFFLARELGMTVGRLLRETTSAELAEWQAYYSLLSQPEPEDLSAQLKKTLLGVRR